MLAVAAACGARPVAPARLRPTARAPVPPAAYVYYIRGRVAFYGGDYLTAVRELRRARRTSPDEPELAAALAQAALLYLSDQ